MNSRVRVHLLPSLLNPVDLTGGAAVVIDVLRASTTMIQAVEAGAARICPCASIEEARARAEQYSATERLLGGERHGVSIEGFDLDNSPLRYTRERVSGKTVIFTTTNGTLALQRSQPSARVCVGGLVNLSAVEAWLRRSGLPVHLVCAGTDRQVSGEDVLFAGLLADRLLGDGTRGVDASTELAVRFARAHGGSADAILAALRASAGGENLLALGYDADIEFAARIDTHGVVPEWDSIQGELRAAAVE
jgi:2-phosphosulfolactate phosphatase